MNTRKTGGHDQNPPITASDFIDIRGSIEIGHVNWSNRTITVAARCQNVDDDGDFSAEHGNRMLRFSFLGGYIGPIDSVEYIRTVTIGLNNPAYVYCPDELSDGVVQVCYFLDASAELIKAPGNFDWWKFSYGEPDFSILQISNEFGDSIVYQSMAGSNYLPYLDERGQYWSDMDVTPPESDSEIDACFDSLRCAISRKGIISDDVRPVSLKWVSGNEVELILRRERIGRCYRVRWLLPTETQMISGGFFVPGSIIDVRSPVAFAGGTIAALQEFGAASAGFGGTECTCP